MSEGNVPTPRPPQTISAPGAFAVDGPAECWASYWS
jgi:hypothetical protein